MTFKRLSQNHCTNMAFQAAVPIVALKSEIQTFPVTVTMSWTFFPNSCLVFDKIFYLAMLGLGIYFIVDGDVIDKFRSKRTNFAISEEDLSELPTITAAVHPLNEEFKYERDFVILYRAGIRRSGDNKEIWDKLLLGKDKPIKDVTVRLQQVKPAIVSAMGLYWFWSEDPPQNLYKITHVKYSGRMHTEFTLRFQFKENVKASKVEITLMPEETSNSSYCNGKYQVWQLTKSFKPFFYCLKITDQLVVLQSIVKSRVPRTAGYKMYDQP